MLEHTQSKQTSYWKERRQIRNFRTTKSLWRKKFETIYQLFLPLTLSHKAISCSVWKIMLEFEVSVFDADDVNGEGLTYTWVGGASSTPLAGCGGLGGVGRTCSTPVIQEFVTTFPVKVTVADAHGGSVTEEIIRDLERCSSI